MKTVEVLERGLELVKHGWTQGKFYSDGRVCSMGAINRIVHDDTNDHGFIAHKSKYGQLPERLGAIRYLHAAAVQEGLIETNKKDINRQYNEIISMNDSYDRTKEQVVAVFERAVRNARRRHING